MLREIVLGRAYTDGGKVCTKDEGNLQVYTAPYAYESLVLVRLDVNMIQLVDQCKLFHMNELEVALWSFYVDAFKCDPEKVSEFVQLTAFEAKVRLTSPYNRM